MRYYPVFLDIEGRPCLVVGGGPVAARKAKGLLAAGGRVRVISPELEESLLALHRQGTVSWTARGYRQGDLAGAVLVVAATDDVGVQEAVSAEAAELGIPVNVADVPRLCSFILPAVVNRGDLTVAVSTAGKSPALAKRLRLELETRFGPEYGVLLEVLGDLRGRVLSEGRPQKENEELFNRLLHPEMPEWVRRGDWDRVERHVQQVLGSGYTVRIPDVSPPTGLAERQ